ncbi:unnamed protein product [Durusdinium trenchii]|uniref:Uncharacterized protein n=2 Tax=Durusdinium trenchii TaxID=1381693 RepID=A0ABP0N6D0_9DINO
MPKVNPIVFIDEALLPESRDHTSHVKAWPLKAVDRKLPRTPSGALDRGKEACFIHTRGALHRTMSAAARLGQRFTYVEEKAEMPEPFRALPPIPPLEPAGAAESEGVSPDDEGECLVKVQRRKKKHVTMPARLGPMEEMSSARMEDIGKAARGRLPSEPLLPDIGPSRPLLTLAGEPDLPVIMRRKKKVATMPELRRTE